MVSLDRLRNFFQKKKSARKAVKTHISVVDAAYFFFDLEKHFLAGPPI